jgi:hypothetical protein
MIGYEYLHHWDFDFLPIILIIVLLIIALSDSKTISPLNEKMNKLEELELSNQTKLDQIWEGIIELRKYAENNNK